MPLNRLEVRYGVGGWGAANSWIIVVREQGHVETLEFGQQKFMPVFRTRRVSCTSGYNVQVRVLVGARARLNFADLSVLHLNGPLEVAIVYCDTATIDTDKVFYMRLGKCAHDVAKLLGKQYRFEPKPGLGPLGGRG